MRRAIGRLALIWLVTLAWVLSSCAVPEGNTGRPAPTAAAPDPSANDPCKTNPGCALLQASWDGDRPHNVSWKVGKGLRETLRVDPYRNEDGRWKGLFQLPVTVEHGDPVEIAADPVYGIGLTIVAVYHLGVELCDSLPGSNVTRGVATCTVTIP